jgi:hypothetical protein
MNTIFFSSKLNPAFKATQPLPLLPVDFVARHARAASSCSGTAVPRPVCRLEASVADSGAMRLRNEVNAQVARLVA